jgi:hypothetical protein
MANLIHRKRSSRLRKFENKVMIRIFGTYKNGSNRRIEKVK